MTTINFPTHTHAHHLRNQIDTKQRQQAERRIYLAGLQQLIAHHDRELANLQTQLAALGHAT